MYNEDWRIAWGGVWCCVGWMVQWLNVGLPGTDGECWIYFGPHFLLLSGRNCHVFCPVIILNDDALPVPFSCAHWEGAFAAAPYLQTECWVYFGLSQGNYLLEGKPILGERGGEGWLIGMLAACSTANNSSLTTTWSMIHNRAVATHHSDNHVHQMLVEWPWTIIDQPLLLTNYLTYYIHTYVVLTYQARYIAPHSVSRDLLTEPNPA